MRPGAVAIQLVAKWSIVVSGGLYLGQAISLSAASNGNSGLDFLAHQHDRFHQSLAVYSDRGSAGNHFVEKGRFSSAGDEEAVAIMDEDWTERPATGRTCVKCEFKSKSLNWGGWIWMNGTLTGDARAPSQNWGEVPDAGVDLSGATQLTFNVRGAKGGERVEFFCLGVGWQAESGFKAARYPDSSRKASTGFVTLTTNWQQRSISLSGRDLSSVLGGFGWAANGPENAGRDIVFFLDEMQFDKATPNEPRFLLSYVTTQSGDDFDLVMQNTAFTYDNAMALLAFLSAGDARRARLLADALVYAQGHDRFYSDGRLRNAYQAGDLTLSPGWSPLGKRGTVRMPGWYDVRQQQWLEDIAQVGTSVGNVAWCMIALLAAHEIVGDTQYLQYLTAAERMGEWVERNCRDERGSGGYMAGFEGWEPSPKKLSFKAAEHNIDLHAAFQRLALITGKSVWNERAAHARKFVVGMWDDAEGKFWTGTGDDGIAISKENITVDIQAWAVLALGRAGKPYWRGLEYAERHHQVHAGFDFDQDRDGVWPEGTAQMATAFHFTGQISKWRAVVAGLKKFQVADGGIVAAEKDNLTTGFYLSDGKPWHYFRRSHVGATAWYVLAEKGTNAFWLGRESK